MKLLDPVTNFAECEVSTGYNETATSIVLSAGEVSKLPDPATEGEFELVWYDSKNYPNPADDPNKEIVTVTAIAGDTLTVERGQQGISATTKNTAGGEYKMILTITKKDMERIDDGIFGWNKITDVIPTRASADDPTYVLTFAGEDLTDKVSVGQKFKFNQDVEALAYYKFEGNSNDEKTTHNGTDTNVTYSIGDGKFNQGVNFDDTSAKIELANPNDFKTTGAFVTGCWFNSSTIGDSFIYSNEDSTGNNSFLLGFSALRGFAVYTQATGWIHAGEDLTAQHLDGNWHLGVCVYDGDSYRLYVDGEMICNIYGDAPTFSTTTYVTLGMRYNNAASQYFTGSIDEFFFIKDDVLSQKEIQKIYNSATEIGAFPYSTEKFGIVTAISKSGGDTNLTGYFGTDHDVLDTSTYAISEVYFSSMHAPFGFPMNEDKWSVAVTTTLSSAQTSPTAGTWYNIGGMSINIPIGDWYVKYDVHLFFNTTSTAEIRAETTLATTSSSETNDKLTFRYGGSGKTGRYTTNASRSYIMTTATKTAYYLNFKAADSGITEIQNRGSDVTTIIKATINYL